MRKEGRVDKPIAKMVKAFERWMQERELIRVRREDKGREWPWTDDEIMQKYKFTNVHRQDDRVTREYTRLVNNKEKKSVDILFFQTFLFRSFNWPDTYMNFETDGLHTSWTIGRARKVLSTMERNGEKIFTGAYIITNAGQREKKWEMMSDAVNHVWRYKKELSVSIVEGKSIENAVGVLSTLPMVGQFVGYEMATDLRWTPLLKKARDIYTWANPGPGAMRGINRIWYGDKDKSPERPHKVSKKDVYIEHMQLLLKKIPKINGVRLEMRDIEHSLCEFDKYQRLKNGEGSVRAKFTPPHLRKENSRERKDKI